MTTALPAGPDPDEPINYDVGAFEQGSPASRWALARYLVGRAIGESMSLSLLILAVGILALAGVVEWLLGSTFWAIVIAVLALGVLAMRALLRAILRRLTAADRFGPLETRMRALVDDTGSDVLAELRRNGLPGHLWTLPLLPLRFIGRQRRAKTVAQLRAFDVDRVVPRSRVDALHLILRETAGP